MEIAQRSRGLGSSYVVNLRIETLHFREWRCERLNVFTAFNQPAPGCGGVGFPFSEETQPAGAGLLLRNPGLPPSLDSVWSYGLCRGLSGPQDVITRGKECILAAISAAWYPSWLLNNVQKEPTSGWSQNPYPHILLRLILRKDLQSSGHPLPYLRDPGPGQL